MKIKNQLWMYVDIYISMKKTPQIISHLIERSPLSLNTSTSWVVLKLEDPCSNIHYWFPLQPMTLTLEKTNRQSWLQYSRQRYMKPISGRYLKRICASSIIAINHSLRRAIQSSHQHTTLSIALWTWPSSLQIFRETAVRWFQDITLSIGIVLRAWSLSCSDVWK